MHISDAKNIPLFQLVQHLGGKYSHTDHHGQQWYFSPFRPNEKTASFKINEPRNTWYDFGHAGDRSATGAGGDTIDLWCDYYGKDRVKGIKEALEALASFTGKSPYPKPRERQAANPELKEAPRFKKLRLHDTIFYRSLTEELSKRRISEAVAGKYLKQIYLQDTQHPDRKLNGFAFANDRGGYEISIPGAEKSFKTSLRPKSPTTFRAKLSKKLFIFEGMWDFLSWQEMQDKDEPEHHTIVLNSLAFTNEIIQQIIAAKEQMDTVLLFLDNDDAGQKAMQFMNEQLTDADFNVRTMETLYQGYKDLNDYWAKDPNAQKITKSKPAPVKYYTEDSAWYMVMNRPKTKPE